MAAVACVGLASLAAYRPATRARKPPISRACCLVTLAGDGEQAIERAAASEPGFDLTLMDVQTPGIDGLEPARQLRRAKVSLPIIALSAHVFDDGQQAALAAGMDAYVTKPLDIAELVDPARRVRDRATALWCAPQGRRPAAPVPRGDSRQVAGPHFLERRAPAVPYSFTDPVMPET